MSLADYLKENPENLVRFVKIPKKQMSQARKLKKTRLVARRKRMTLFQKINNSNG